MVPVDEMDHHGFTERNNRGSTTKDNSGSLDLKQSLKVLPAASESVPDNNLIKI
jgi:hypothetical protein